MVWLDGLRNSIYFEVLSITKFYEVYFYHKKYFTFYLFPLRIQMILRTQFKGIGAFCKRKRLAGEVGGAYRTPSQAFTSTQISQKKTVCLLVTFTVSGSFIIKLLTCISRPLFRRRSCFMFMVPSRYFLSRRRVKNVCCEVSNGMLS